MYYRKFLSVTITLLLVVATLGLASAKSVSDEQRQRKSTTMEPLNLAVLIQDDVVSQVSNELGVTRDFIRSLPQGSRVMVGYITAGSL
jgi:hypothetical protein